jgi:hypothetical protein
MPHLLLGRYASSPDFLMPSRPQSRGDHAPRILSPAYFSMIWMFRIHTLS